MPEYHRGQQQLPSPSSKTGPMLPPLSKYYYGPAQGWSSTESSPSHNGSSWSLSHHDIPPTVPPRISSGTPLYTSPQWINLSPYSAESSQGWHSPGLPPSLPPAGQLASPTPTSHGCSVAPVSSHSHVNPTWDSDFPDQSTWDVNHDQKATPGSEPAPKPRLPPRSHPQAQDQSISPKLKTPSSRMSATTIEVPVFLQPVAYDPASVPPLPESRQPLAQNVQTSILFPPEPDRHPPPPPQKIPLGHNDMPQSQKFMPQRPWHDPQHSYDGGQQNFSQLSQRPRFDPQNSHDLVDSPYAWRDSEDGPTIPVPQFTSFDVESALPPQEPQRGPSLPSQQNLPQSKTVISREDSSLYTADEILHKSSLAPVSLNDAKHWAPSSKLWESQAACVLSPEQQHAILSQPDGPSISTNDISISTADISNSESHQTSTALDRENEDSEEQGKAEHQGDDSFYWHSGRSSSDAEEEQSQSGSPTATPGDDSVGQRSPTTSPKDLQRKHQECPIRSSSLSPKFSATYGASALGFGGPSDWEYFGDYEAEEIDDEELYSRPRPRDSETLVEGSFELPVDLSRVSAQPPIEVDTLGSGFVRLGTPLHRTNPARSLGERLPQEDVLLEVTTSSEGDYGTDARPLSADSPVTPRATSIQAESSSETHGPQRPDLDDIIRAWSEAPFVGKVHDNEPGTGIFPGNDEEPANIAEASLASTPRERILGGDVILKSAPSLPKLPDFKDLLNADERELPRNANSSPTQSNAVSTASHRGWQIQPLMGQQKPMTNGLLANAEIEPGREEKQTSKNESTMKDVSPPVDLIVSSGLPVLIPTEPTINSTCLDIDPSPGTFTDLSTQGSTQASPEKNLISSDERHHSSSQRKDLDLGQQTSEKVIPEKLGSEEQEDIKSNSQPEEAELSKPSRGILSYGPNITASSETSETLSYRNLVLEQSPAFLETTQESHSPCTPRKTSQESLDSKDGVKPPQNHLQKRVMTPNTHATSSISPPTDQPIDAPSPPTRSPFTSVASPPHHKTSLEVDRVQDPYSDLDPWGKASLNRFAAMLREESRAETNKDKLNLFNVFTSRESRLRVVLYGTDDDLIIPQKAIPQKLEITPKPEKGGFVKQAVERANSLGLERSLKALPALPANRESVAGLSLKVRPIGADPKSKEESEISSPPRGDKPYAMTDSLLDKVQCSPGARVAATPMPSSGRGMGVELSRDSRSASEQDGNARPITSESARRAAPPNLGGPTATVPEDRENRQKPEYRPLINSEGRSEVKNYLANRKSVCRPYATLTQESLENASTFGREPDIKLQGAAGIIKAPTSQYQFHSQVRVDVNIETATTNKQKVHEVEGPSDLRRFVKADFDPLLLALPTSDAVVHESARILDLKNVMEAVPDDFSFIHQSVVAWDAKAKKQREENDKQRHARQIESEQKIDSLFDDHEIGYGDIAELEIEFKRSEAARRADEDRSEYQTFVSDVFDLVWTRLHYELDQLIPHYDQYSKLMDHTLAGKEMFEGSKEGLALGPTMSTFLALHQKLEIRYQKAFEAVLERDRRLKKTELSPWYTLSNIAKVKQLDKQFEDAEKKAIIEYCQQRDARANHLMDVLDQSTLRGVGANQDYMEAIMKAVRRIASGRAFASVPEVNEPSAGLEEVEKAKAITALLALSSEQIVQTFHVADMLLNSADYEVSVAKAKVAKADMATLAKLKEERAKEDQKLMRELEHRLALIREDSRRTNDEIVKLMLFLGVRNGRADGTPTHIENADT